MKKAGPPSRCFWRPRCEIIAADIQTANVQAIRDEVAHAVEQDGTDPPALRTIEASLRRTAVVTMGEDFGASVLSVAALREVGVSHVVARANNPRERRILLLVEASEIVEIEADIGRRLAIDLTSNERRDAAKAS